ncbi:hypothetical protein FNV43_RR12128 [Rhamnella rubrinervis]|uniref:CP12 domain-containing protein n=1 Tax=Rhamnella rubrinervis TaxID=2594499 RepID=A0A8K0MII6_9ROSA|nr:hypothetical protein FNV43_RR12128 [Rhamnella rubrinervis]
MEMAASFGISASWSSSSLGLGLLVRSSDALPLAVGGNKPILFVGGKRKGVKAMAVAKFKGTQMREKKLTEMIEKKVLEAKEVCQGDETSDECKVAWDEVEEVSQAKADLRRKLENQQDPLESFCLQNPETDECRIYD